MTDTPKDICDWAEEYAELQWARCGPGLAPLTEMRLEAGTACTDFIESRMGIHLADYEQDMAGDVYTSWVEDYLTERVNDVLRGLPLLSRGIYPFAIVSLTKHGWRCRLSFSRYNRFAVELNQVQAALDSAVKEAS